jgi:3-oxoacyl-[acyl-carrier-protein] synthase II
MKGNKVVVTGLGAVTPLGLDVATSWQGICAGASGAANIDQFDASAFTTRFSASVKSFSVEGYLEPAMPAGWILLSNTGWSLAFRLFVILVLR